MNKSHSEKLAEHNRLRTTQKVEAALKSLKKSKASITIKSVSEKAGISRKTIYNRQDLKLKIEEYQSYQNDLNGQDKEVKAKKENTQGYRLNKLREQNKELKEEKMKVLEQNMVLTDKVTQLLNRLADLEEKLQSQNELKVVSIRE